ncbi:MAG: ABC transporter permease [bacterium]
MGAVLVILKREMLIYARDRSYVVSSIFRPILWLFVIGFGIGSAFKGGGEDYMRFIFPGIIGMAILFTSVFFGMSIIWDRQFGFLKVMLVAPVARVYVVLAKMLSGSIISVFQGVFVLALGPFLGVKLTVFSAVLCLLVMFVGSMALTSLGIFIASRMESFEGFGLIMNFIVMPMFFLSGALFPVESIPPYFQWFIYVNPLSYCVDLLRYVLIGTNSFSLVLDAAMVSGFTGAVAYLAGVNFSRN